MVARSVNQMLEQGLLLLGELTPDDYVHINAPHFSSSIGAHYRHILDHVEILIQGMQNGCVNYDARCRDVAVETCLETAKGKTKSLLSEWDTINDGQMTDKVDVVCKVCYDEEDSPKVNSTVGREAMFTSIHGVHHFALIKVMCQLRGLQMGNVFGVAPATVAHQQK